MKLAFDKLASIAQNLASASASALREIQQLRLRRADTRRALDHAQTAPVPKSELVQSRIPAVVQQLTESFLRRDGRGVVEFLGEPTPNGDLRLPWRPDAPVAFDFLCAAAPELATAMLTRIVEQVPYESNVPSAERPALIARLEGELQALEQADEQLTDQAIAAGVQIEHRPEVVSRRQTEARRARWEEEAGAERRRRQEVVHGRADQ
jgi:hypothetical protein